MRFRGRVIVFLSKITQDFARKTKSALVFAGSFLLAQAALANPVLDKVVSGDVVLTTSPNTLNVNQSSQKAIIDWKTFNINTQETTHFQQPTGGVAFNFINPTQGASQIYGHLTATGQIVLINPAGVHFGPSAYVNVGGLIATTASISKQDILNGNYQFQQVPGYSGSVINQGQIISNGLVALVAPGVVNNGIIQANLGRVILASGDAYTLNFSGDGLINFKINAPTTSAGVDQNGNSLSSGVSNTGAIFAPGGQVLMTAQSVAGVLDRSIDMRGTVEVKAVYQQGGSIIISGDPNSGKVIVDANLNASGKGNGQQGGSIQITGHDIWVGPTSLLDVSGDAGGGKINIGGSFQGKGPLPNASSAYFASGASLIADAITNGNGGDIVLWSDGETNAHGLISAQGGLLSGNGGNVETSGHQLDIAGLSVNLSAPQGKTGNWLLDPADLSIEASGVTTTTQTGSTFSPNSINSTLLVADLLAALANANVTILTTVNGSGGNGDIFVNTPINWTSANNLTLSAYRDIRSSATITNTGGASVVLQADNTGTGTGTVSFTSGNVNLSNLSGESGKVSIYYNPITFGTQDPTPIYSGGTAPTQYMLINQLGDSTDSSTTNGNPRSLANFSNTSAYWNQNFALSKDIDASATSGSGWNGGSGFLPIASTGSFTGQFDGQGHVISNLFFNLPSLPIDNTYYIGLFGTSDGIIQNLGLSTVTMTTNALVVGALAAVNGGIITNSYVDNVSISGVMPAATRSQSPGTGFSGSDIGGLVGYNRGTISNSYAANVLISGDGYNVGGLVGVNANFFGPGIVSNSYASGIISGYEVVGGLVGANQHGTVINSYAATSVYADPTAGTYIGGLVAVNYGAGAAIINSYSSGAVNGGTFAGGLLGYALISAANVQSSVWDMQTSGKSNSAGGTGRTTDQMRALSTFVNAGWNVGTDPNTNTWVMLDGMTRPMLAMEYSSTIRSAHALQLIGLNATTLGGHYTLNNNINLNGTFNPADVWAGGKFIPIGNSVTPFTGSLDGLGHAFALSNITITPSADELNSLYGSRLGVFGTISNTASIVNTNLNLNNTTFLFNQSDLTICASCTASTSTNAMLSAAQLDNLLSIATGNFSLQATGTSNDALGNIIINAPIAWSSNGNLNLTAYRNITSNASITNNGGSASVRLQADSSGSGLNNVSFTSGNVDLSGGTGTVSIYYNPTNFGSQDTIYSGGTSPTQYMLINSLGNSTDTTTASLAALSNTSNAAAFWSQNFALNNNIDASDTATWNNGAGFASIGDTITPFSGLFDSLGHSISNLAISFNTASPPVNGLFGVVSNPSSASFKFNVSGTAKAYTNTILGPQSRDATYQVNNSGMQFALLGGSPSNFILSLLPANLTICTSCTTTPNILTSNDSSILLNTADLNNLLFFGHVRLQTSGTLSDNLGNILVNSLVNWGSANNLTLSAYRNIISDASITNNGGASVILQADNTGVGPGTVADPFGRVSFTSGNNVALSGGTGKVSVYYNPLVFGTQDTIYSGDTLSTTIKYMLINQLGSSTDSSTMNDNPRSLANLSNTTAYWTRNFALSADIDASLTKDWNGGNGFSPIGRESPLFTGRFDGQGHVISNLFITPITPSPRFIGLFGRTSAAAIIQNIGLLSITVKSSYRNVAGLVGGNAGTISNAYVSGGSISSQEDIVGGLVGSNTGTISNSYVSGVSVSGNNNVGGLAGTGRNIFNSYASAAVSGNSNVGGLVGNSSGTISNSYATGVVSGNSNVGGLVGIGGNTQNSFWDTQTSGRSTSAGGTGQTTDQLLTLSTYRDAGWNIGTNLANNTWVMFDGMTRPMLAMEYSSTIATAHALQLAGLNATTLGGHYTLSNNIDLGKGISNPADVWAGGKFIPIGNGVTPFTGSFDGLGHTLNDITINLSANALSSASNILSPFGIASNTASISNLNINNAAFLFNQSDLTICASCTASSSSVMLPVTQLEDLLSITAGNFRLETKALGNIMIDAPIAWNNNTNLILSAYGNITSNTSITNNSNGSASVHLQADNSGTGSGTVSFTSGNNVNLFGGSGTVSIYYNPSTFGMQETIYSGSPTLPTQYMLINQLGSSTDRNDTTNTRSLATLSNTSGYWDKNFALSKDIDAIDTATWNNGAGFASIGNTTTPFSGLFDSLGHSISHLAISYNINSPSIDGLFGIVSNPSPSFNFNISGLAKVSGNTIFGPQSGNFSYQGNTLGMQFTLLDRSPSDFMLPLLPADLTIGTSATTPDILTSTGSSLSLNTADLTNLLFFGNVRLQTSGTTADNLGDILVNAPITWGTANNLTLSAYRNITSSASMTNINGASVVLQTDNMGMGPNTVADPFGHISFTSGNNVALSGGSGKVSLYYNSIIFGTQDTIYSGGTLPIQYMLINQLGSSTDSSTTTNTRSLATLSNTSGYWNQNFALSANIDATATSGSDWNGGNGFSPIGSNTTSFTGRFDGQGHVINNLFITNAFITLTAPPNNVGFFASLSGTIQNVRFSSLTVKGINLMFGGSLYGVNVGGLAGYNNGGTISNTYISGAISGDSTVGGLVGYNSLGTISNTYVSGTVTSHDGYMGGLVGYNSGGTISNSYTSANVSNSNGGVTGGIAGYNVTGGIISNSYASGTVSGSSNVGGLVGYNSIATISNSYAIGAVNGNSEVGGLVGVNFGNISNSYASGTVSGTSNVGGLVGNNLGNVQNSFWDMQTSGQSTSSEGRGGTTAQLLTLSTYSNLGWNIGTDPKTNTWVMFDGLTRPMLAMEYTSNIKNAHALQLIGMNATTLGARYTLNNNIDLGSILNPADVWAGKKFIPVGNSVTPFTGSFDGLGHTFALSNITITPSANELNSLYSSKLGVFGTTSNTASIVNLNLNINNTTFLFNLSDLTLCASCAASTSTNAMFSVAQLENLLSIATGNFSLQTTGTSTGTLGNILINAPIVWSSNANLNLSAYKNITSNASITNTGGASVRLQADHSGTGSGTVSFASGKNVALSGGSGKVSIYYNPTNFGSQNTIYSGGTLPIKYMLINSLGTPTDTTTASLATLSNRSDFWSQNFALNNNIDANATSTWNNGAGFKSIGNATTPFSGLFDSLGHSISHLAISFNTSLPPIDGLFGMVSHPSPSFNFNVSGTAKTSGNTILGPQSGNAIYQVNNSGIQFTILNPSNFIFSLLPAELTICTGTSCTTTPNILTSNASSLSLNTSDLSNLLFFGNVRLQTSGTPSDNLGDIVVNAPITWANSTNLTLSAYRNIISDANITNTGGASVILQADNTGIGPDTAAGPFGHISFTPNSNVALSGGSGTVRIYYNPITFGTQDPISIYSGGTLPTQYMLINQLGSSTDSSTTTNTRSLATLSNSSSYWNQNFALSANIDASATSSSWNGGSGFSPIGDANTTFFTGQFDGQGHVISNLFIMPPTSSVYVGLFGALLSGLQNIGSGIIQNIGLSSVSFKSNTAVYMGGLVGYNASGTISNSYVSGGVVSGDFAGGLVGGLVGLNQGGTISNSYASAAVSGGVSGNGSVGGLAGYNSGNISNSYASGTVSGGSNVGGLVGGGDYYGNVQNSFWDTQTSGQSISSGGGTGNTTAQLLTLSTYSNAGWNIGTDPNANTWLMFDGLTRPMLAMEYSSTIRTAHALQLIGINATTLSEHYTLNNNIDLSGISNPADVWAGKKFVPIGNSVTPFTGSLDSLGYMLSFNNITTTVSANELSSLFSSRLGLFGTTSGTGTASLSNLNLSANNISLLLAPSNLIICDSCTTSSSNDAIFPVSELENLLSIITGSFNLKTQGTSTGALGNILIDAPIGWSSNANLNLSAYRNITSNANITNTGSASVRLQADNSGTGSGTVSFASGKNVALSGGTVRIYYNPGTFGLQETIYSGSTTTPIQYMLINSLGNPTDTTTASLATLSNRSDFWSENFALNNNIDASNTATWNNGAGFKPIGSYVPGTFSGTFFTGQFDGLGHIISNLTINPLTTAQSSVGLFGVTGANAVVSNLGLYNAHVNVTLGFVPNQSGYSVGTLIGDNFGTVNNVFTGNAVITANGQGFSNALGGLIGDNEGSVSNAYSMGSINYTGDSNSSNVFIGGLIGLNNTGKTVTNVYSTVTSTSSGNGVSTGGLIGNNLGNVQNSFWDKGTSGRSSAFGLNTGNSNVIAGCFSGTCSGTVGLNLPTTFTAAGWDFNNTWGIVLGNKSYPYLLAFYSSQPQVISGQVSQFTSTHTNVAWASMPQSEKGPLWSSLTPLSLPGQTINLIANGNIVDTTTTGANGAYYFLEGSGTIAAGTPLLTHLSNSINKGNTITTVPTGNGSISGLSIALNTLLIDDNGVPNYSYVPPDNIGVLSNNPLHGLSFTRVSNNDIATVLGELSSNDFLFTISGTNINLKNNINFVTSPNTLLGLTGDINVTNASIVFNGPAAINPMPATNNANITLQTNGGGNIVLSNMVSDTRLPYTLNLNSANNIILNGQLILADNNVLGNQMTAGSLNVSAAYTDQSITTQSNLYLNNFNLLQGKWFQRGQGFYNGATGIMLVQNNFQINSGIMPSSQAEFLQVQGGSGTPSDPYLINNVIALQGIGSSSYTLGLSYIYFNDIPAVAYSSLWNYDPVTQQYAGFVPIGTASQPFTGNLLNIPSTGYFGYPSSALNQISDIYINRPTTDNVGLFGVTSPSAVIDHLVLTNSAITGHDNVGAMVGLNQGTLRGGLTVKSSFIVGNNNVGDFVGVNNGSLTSGNAYNNRLLGNNAVGGIAGQNNGLINQFIIANYIHGNTQVGGLAGINTGTIQNSFWDTNVTGQGNAVGSNLGTLDHVTGGCLTGVCANGGTANLSDIKTYLTTADGGYGLVPSSWNWTIIPGVSYPDYNGNFVVISGKLSAPAANEFLLGLGNYRTTYSSDARFNTFPLNFVTGADGSFYTTQPKSFLTFYPNFMLITAYGGNIAGSVSFTLNGPGESVTNIPLATKPNGAATTTNHLALSTAQIFNLVVNKPVNARIGDFTYYYQQIYSILYTFSRVGSGGYYPYFGVFQSGLYGAIYNLGYKNYYRDFYNYNGILGSIYFQQNQNIYAEIDEYIEKYLQGMNVRESIDQILSSMKILDGMDKYDIQSIKPAFCGKL